MPAIGRSSWRTRRMCGLAAVELLAERLQPLDRLGLQPAVGQFLDPIGKPALEEAPVVGRRLGVEERRAIAPSGRACDAVLRAAIWARTEVVCWVLYCPERAVCLASVMRFSCEIGFA